MNGRGVFSSKNMGRLIVTLEPRRERILAVNVLYNHGLPTEQEAHVENAYGKRAWGFVISSGKKRL